jgi:hypothetical protein
LELQIQDRRNRQFFEQQLQQEKKFRKQAEDKANTAPRCPESCRVKKLQLEGENNRLRREIILLEETKQNLEKQTRIYEHEVCFKN